MREPDTLLPWNFREYPKSGYSVRSGSYTVFSAGQCEEEWPDIDDAKYIVEACNNYPKAIEMLKLLYDLDENSNLKEAFKVYRAVEDFFNSIGVDYLNNGDESKGDT